ncbi:MAG: hypothetical protein Q8S03_06845 [Brevundimonas sp.]|uniref:hypothetical protein n=1 Tax=Brevundimonas sp. TaxID=1871086 RepID=UPI002733FA10|nr:hypothetical protein [Brevundimonas sp.]MDP3404392.1 hypothetical protein [Brevundimonas sp.]
MKTPVRPRLLSPSGRRNVGVFALSVLFHAAVLTPIGLGLFSAPPERIVVPSPPLFVEMEPRPLLSGETARVPAPAASPATREPAPALGETLPSLPRTRLRDEEDEDGPSAPAPRPGTPAPPGAPSAPTGAWTVTPEGMAAAVGRSLRTGPAGCRTMDGRLSPGEQALCDDRFNEAAGRAGPLGPRTLNASEARREAGFARDGARALAQYEARRRPLSGGSGIVGPGDCPGSNLGAGCAGAHLDPAIRQGATTVANPGLGSNDPNPMRPIPGQE